MVISGMDALTSILWDLNEVAVAITEEEENRQD